MRTFSSGATRDSDNDKLDFEGFLCPLALTRYAEYLHSHRKQADGKIRASDNWQSGIPGDVYVKSLFRHFVDLWTMHRGHVVTDRKDGHVVDSEEALCAVIFNAFGLLHETLIDKGTPPLPAEAATDVSVAPDAEVDRSPKYSEVCFDCKNSPRSCSQSSVPLQSPCSGWRARSRGPTASPLETLPAEAATDAQVNEGAPTKCTRSHATWVDCPMHMGFSSDGCRMCHLKECAKPPVADYTHGES